MVAVMNTLPGMKFSSPMFGQATLIDFKIPHPLWPTLALVIWIMEDGSVSLDALSPRQDLGEPEPFGAPLDWREKLRTNLEQALLGRSV